MNQNEGTYDESLLLMMERHGYIEETYYTFSYSPVPNDKGGVGGIFCANTDDTQRIIGERQLTLLRELASRTVLAKSLDELFKQSSESLASNSWDLPFTAIYMIEDAGQSIRLAGASGIEVDHPAAPQKVRLSDSVFWPFKQVIKTGQAVVVEDLEKNFKSLPMGAWNNSPHQAVVVPISQSGQNGTAGVLIVGLNPFRLFDEGYKGFINLIAGQLAANVADVQAYEEERKRAKALAEIDRAKTAFFSNVSHEFRTPLTLMLGPIQDVLNKDENHLLAEDRELLTVAHRNALRLQKLVNTLLDFSRIEAGREQATYRPTNLSNYTAELASNFRSAIEKAGLVLTVDCPPIPELIYIDQEMWEKVVLNLISNAFKHTFKGEIKVSIAWGEGDVELTVQDTGIGIPPDQLPHLFKRFHRVLNARSRTHEGSGIGLALVSELVKLHAGEVTVDSKVEEGTKFSISIPAGKNHLPHDRIVEDPTAGLNLSEARSFIEEALRWLPEDSETLKKPANGFQSVMEPGALQEPLVGEDISKARIVLADDNADMREYVRRLLAPYCYVEAVRNGREALEAAQVNPPDLILSDVMMPEMDGFELLKRLRDDSNLRHIPVILLSARAGEEARVDGLLAGADDYLTKPFSARELLAHVRTNLKLFKVRREAQDAIKISEARLRAIVETTPECIKIVGRDGTLQYMNKAGICMVEADSAAAVSGACVFDIIAPEHRESWIEKHNRICQGESMVWEFDIIGLQGSRRWMETHAVPLSNPDGTFSQLAVTRDITQRKQLEAAIRESEEHYRFVSNSTPVMLWITDGSHRCTYLNQTWLDFTGQKLEEGLGTGWLKAAHPEDRDSAGEVFIAAANDRRPFSLDYRLKRKDGEYRWAVDSGAPLFDKNGEFLGYTGYVVDIHDRKIAEQQLQILTRELASRNEDLAAANEEIQTSIEELADKNNALTAINSDLDNFIYTASHDLKSPIANIEGLVHALERSLKTESKQKEVVPKLISMIYSSVERFKTTIGDLTEITKLQKELQEVPTEIDLKEIIESVKMDLDQQIMEANALLIIDIDSCERIKFSKKNLKSIIYNLLSNAVKYRSPERRAHIQITCESLHEYVVLVVTDNGLGFNVSATNKVFSMFKRLHVHVEGSGIGLYIVKKIVDDAGGKIEVQSEVDNGATFKIYFRK